MTCEHCGIENAICMGDNDKEIINCMADQLMAMDLLLAQARRLCDKFVYKVESGRAVSAETYQDCLSFIEKHDVHLKGEETRL